MWQKWLSTVICASTWTDINCKNSETLHFIPVHSVVWIQISIDMSGPLKEIKCYRYMVTAVNYTSKFVEMEPLRDKVNEVLLKFLYKWLCQYGSGYIHITDQRSKLVNSTTEEFYCLTGIHHCITSTYHPQANVIV